MTDRIKILIAKYFSDSLTKIEAEELVKWVEKKNNKDIFNQYINLNYSLYQLQSHEFNSDLLWQKIQFKINSGKRKNPIFKYVAAAVIMLLLSLPFVINNKNPDQETPIIVNNTIEIGTDKAILTLEDGSEIVLEKGQEYASESLVSNGEEIIYNEKAPSTTKKEIVYNYLTIPRGGQYFVKLSDGTKIWLNSESQLKYPKRFIDGQTREVQLVYGEAYFDVSPSIEHQGANFKVLHKAQEVQVLGTEFNIKAYKDEVNVYTTLVEGKVSITSGANSKTLVPSQQSTLDISNNKISVATVNLRPQISWKEGLYIFKDQSLKDIMITLSRWYDMNVVFENKELKNIQFNGALYKDHSIIDILNDIKNFGVIKNYEINNKTITLK